MPAPKAAAAAAMLIFTSCCFRLLYKGDATPNGHLILRELQKEQDVLLQGRIAQTALIFLLLATPLSLSLQIAFALAVMAAVASARPQSAIDAIPPGDMFDVREILDDDAA